MISVSFSRMRPDVRSKDVLGPAQGMWTRGTIAQLVAADLAESEQRIDERSVQNEVLQLGRTLVRTGIGPEDRSDHSLCALDDIGVRRHPDLAEQRIQTDHRGSLRLVANEGVDMELRG